MKRTVMAVALAFAMPVSGLAREGHHDESKEALKGEAQAQMITVTGEVLDMACYIDHHAMGEKHASCARTCIESGLPVGIKADNGKTYLLIGEHKPINKLLTPYAAKTITVRGKAVSRDGFNMIENVEIVK